MTNDAVHLLLLRDHMRAVWLVSNVPAPKEEVALPSRSSFVSNVIKSKIVKDHSIPVVFYELSRNVSSDIVINLGEVLRTLVQRRCLPWAVDTYRDEEARGTISAVKCTREEL